MTTETYVECHNGHVNPLSRLDEGPQDDNTRTCPNETCGSVSFMVLHDAPKSVYEVRTTLKIGHSNYVEAISPEMAKSSTEEYYQNEVLAPLWSVLDDTKHRDLLKFIEALEPESEVTREDCGTAPDLNDKGEIHPSER